ncbi:MULTISPECIES: acyl-CoA thioesterase [unclassified Pseudomonas]|uniref:acyl-CoA thioesterase n=1 Tax=unclassified Pseudomonas TaxID=196821 RepID=UPI0018E76C97|nr:MULTISPECIES: thioesterase family protein [unclassified Pseudomonas]MBJ2303708.1 thioesterase family protein [Pseudomonas sp. MF2846]MBK3490299.1 thioesterase family protein [Pseudomonas sp. MF2857]
MPRLQLELKEEFFCFSTTHRVRMSEINAGNHLGNDTLISLISDARTLFLCDHGMPPEDVANSRSGTLITDLATLYKAPAFFNDQLLIEVGVTDLNKHGGDFIYRITRQRDARVIALAKNGFVFFDFVAAKVVEVPAEFRERFTTLPENCFVQ